MSNWIINRLPEPNRAILIYDLFEGIGIGYMSNDKEFFIMNFGKVKNVSGWMELPEKCNSTSRIMDNINTYKLFV